MSDPSIESVMAEFNDLAGRELPVERWPGSRHVIDHPGRRRTYQGRVTKKDEESLEWDTRPLTFRVGGHPREFFDIRALSNAIGFSIQSIRLWERQQRFPTARWRTPDLPDGKTKGKRLYTREQIEGLVAIALEEGPFTPKKPATKTNFLPRAMELFALLDLPPDQR